MVNTRCEYNDPSLFYGRDWLSDINERQLLRLSQIAEGKDPDASQTLTDFMDMKNIVERSNLPTTDTVLCMTGLDVAGQVVYQSAPNNIFFMFRDSLARSFMARHGEKAQQFVEMTKRTPSVVDLQTVREDQQRGMIDKITGRGKNDLS